MLFFLPGNTYTADQIESDNEEADTPTPQGSPTKEKMLPDSKEDETGGDGPKVVEEATRSGDVKWSLYWKYFRAGGGYFILFMTVLFNAITQILFTGW